MRRTIADGKIYFRRMYGLAWASKCLSCINLDGTGEYDVINDNTDPLKIVVSGDKIYYYSDVNKNNVSGIYCINKDVTGAKLTDATLILAREQEESTKFYAEDFTVSNGYIYFVNYYNTLGNSHFYRVNISSGEAEQLA